MEVGQPHIVQITSKGDLLLVTFFLVCDYLVWVSCPRTCDLWTLMCSEVGLVYMTGVVPPSVCPQAFVTDMYVQRVLCER